MLLCDEAHHAVSKTGYKNLTSNSFEYRYYFTATMVKAKYADMADIELFGNVLYSFNMRNAIMQNYICDYSVVGCFYSN